MKQFINKAVRDFKSLNNQNDPTALELMRRNRDKYGVPVRKQFSHALNALWILPGIYVLSTVGGAVEKMHLSQGNYMLFGLVLTGVAVYGMYKFVSAMEDSDPVEQAKRGQRPQLVMPNRGSLPSNAKLIVASDGKVYDLEGNYVSTLA